MNQKHSYFSFSFFFCGLLLSIVSSAAGYHYLNYMGNSESTTTSSSTSRPSKGNPNDPAMSQRFTAGGGCFWGTQHWFQKQFGSKISDVKVGYVGGSVVNPTYRQVCSGSSGHCEAVTFKFDPNQVSYNELLKFFFRMHNPTTLNRQGNDAGTQYRSAVFFHNSEQKELVEKMIDDFNTSGSQYNQLLTKAFGGNAKISTTVENGDQTFYDAEDYHQDYIDMGRGSYCNHRIYFSYP